jgi:hypothetical protein
VPSTPDRPLLDVVEAAAELAQQCRRPGQQLLPQALPASSTSARTSRSSASTSTRCASVSSVRTVTRWAAVAGGRRRDVDLLGDVEQSARQRGGELLGAGVEAGADRLGELRRCSLSRALRARSSETSSPVADTMPEPSSSKSRRRARTPR